MSEYNGSLTREQFLFYETRIVALLITQGKSRDEISKKIIEENLFQFPTERMIPSITKACFKRIDVLESETLVYRGSIIIQILSGFTTLSIRLLIHKVLLYVYMEGNMSSGPVVCCFNYN